MSQTETPRQDTQVAEAADRLIRQLDALFRDPEQVTDAAADAAAATWIRGGGAALTFKGGGVWLGEVAAGVAGDTVADWPWTLAQAGLRAMQPRPTLTGSALRVLAERTAAAPRTTQGAAQLRAWAWSGGAPGLRLDLAPAPWQLPARQGYGLPPRAALDEARSAAVAQLTGRARRDAPHDSADLARTCQLAGAQRATTLIGAQRSAQDAAVWITATLSALEPSATSTGDEGEGAAAPPGDTTADGGERPAGDADRPREVVSPDLLAQVTLEQLTRGATLELESVWNSLGAAERPVARALRDRVTAHDAGRAAGQTLPLDQAHIAQVSDLLEAGTPFAAGVVSGLLARAVDAKSVEALTAVLKHLGVDRCWTLADLSGISALSARGLARVLKLLDAGATQWADLIGAAPPAVAAWVLKGAPPHIVSRVGPRLRQQLMSRPPEDLAPLVSALIAMDQPVPIRALGEAFLETKGQGWSGRLVPEVCQALLAHGLGADVLVPLFLDRGADEQLRLLVLRSLDADRELLEAATRFRLGEIVEPKRIQARLKAARKDLKGRR